jgi:hypothetical protein
MGNDDSVQIAATSSGRRRALARMWRGERASGREMVEGIVVPVGAAPIAQNRKSAWRADGKFSVVQSLENPQNAEGISILREPVPRAGRTLAASLAGVAAREGLTARRSRPEMAPQRLEKIESAPGNGRVSEASNPQYLVYGARLSQRSLGPIQPLAKVVGGHGRDRCSAAAAQPRRRKLSALQSLEKSQNGKILPISLGGALPRPTPPHQPHRRHATVPAPARRRC